MKGSVSKRLHGINKRRSSTATSTSGPHTGSRSTRSCPNGPPRSPAGEARTAEVPVDTGTDDTVPIPSGEPHAAAHTTVVVLTTPVSIGSVDLMLTVPSRRGSDRLRWNAEYEVAVQFLRISGSQRIYVRKV